MFRETLAPDARYAAALVTPANGAFFQQRDAVAGPSRNREAPPTAAPCWLRLSRSGNEFSGSVSADGLHWTEVSRASIPMVRRTYAGLALTSHNCSVLNSALFDNVTVLPADGSHVVPDVAVAPCVDGVESGHDAAGN